PSEPKVILRDIERTVVRPGSTLAGSRVIDDSSADPNFTVPIHVSDVATVGLGGRPRRGVLEKDGNELTGGVVLMRYGENPLDVTHRIKQKIADIQAGLPAGIRIVPGYDRTPLIKDAIGTVSRTLVEAIVTASICVLIVLRHFRTSFIIAVTLPLA